MNTKVYLVGEFENFKGEGNDYKWGIIGLYSSEEKALTKVTNNKQFIATLKIDEDLDMDLEFMANVYYPLNSKTEST